MLGCAGSFPSAGSACSAYLLEQDGFRLLLDFGTGSLGALQRYAGLHAPDAVLLSHLHPDHVFDACTYLVVRRYDPAAPFPPIPLYGPAGTAERLATAYRPGPGTPILPVDDVYDVRTLERGVREIGPFRVTTDHVDHPVETYGVRLTAAGGTVAYSADTGPTDTLTELARGADLLLCEASYLESVPHPPHLHLTGREAGLHATAAGVGRLLLTHLVPAWGDEDRTVDEARAAYAGPVDVVRPGSSYEV